MRFYATTSAHNRVIHFKTNEPVVRSMAWDGSRGGWSNDAFKRNFVPLKGHTAHLPAAAQNYGHNPRQGGLHDHAFYKAG